MDGFRYFLTRCMPLFFIVVLGVSAPVFAADELGLFELEGEAYDNFDGFVIAPIPGDDWETLCNPDFTPGGTCANDGGSPEVFTGIEIDPDGESIFSGGGSKDEHDIPDWEHKNGSVSQKSDITHAFAAAYLNTINTGPDADGEEHENGDLILYFGADRFDNEGNTFLGFWFFLNKITILKSF